MMIFLTMQKFIRRQKWLHGSSKAFTVIAYSIKNAGFVYVLEKIKHILSEAGLALYL